jgi:hypothetical protein
MRPSARLETPETHHPASPARHPRSMEKTKKFVQNVYLAVLENTVPDINEQ